METNEAVQVVFRPMMRVDVPKVAKIERACFRSPWTERMLRSELKNELAHYHVLEENGVMAGYLGMWVLDDEAHITNVAVLPEFRGRGYGRLQMLRGMEAALALDANRMTLEVRQSNFVAQNLYFSLGFEAAGRRKKYYQDSGEDALILWNNDIAHTVARIAALRL